MKCNSLLIYYKEPIKGKKKLFASISPSWKPEPDFMEYWAKNNVSPKIKGKIDLVNTENCEGKIVATVSAIDEPYFGGSSAELKISYKCDKCGQSYYEELPQIASSLSEWITKKLEEE